MIATTFTQKDKQKQKPFRVWDGEGHNFPDGSHRLTLLANSDQEYVENLDGLSTQECLRFLVQRRKPAFNVWFQFGYDVNKMLWHWPLHGARRSLEELWTTGRTWYRGAFCKYVPRKFFTIRYQGASFHSCDTFSFFQESFLESCRKWDIDPSVIIEGKNARSDFASWTAEQVREYNFAELALALQLLERLRDSFLSVNLCPQSWHGPGAIATRWMQRESLSVHYDRPLQDRLDTEFRSAYFGGRTDMAICGEAFAYSYDIASAYPKALTDCISLAPITWEYERGPDGPIRRHSLYHLKWSVPPTIWHPFPWRTANGEVLFPYEGEGWYWGVEAEAASALFPGRIYLLEAYHAEGEQIFPFAQAVTRDYAERFRIGKDTGAGKAIRLGLNSLYGKLCQHVTSDQKKVPRWQNYVWAGYVTAYTRAMLLRAIKELGQRNVLSVATDGILSRVPMAAAPSSSLGGWELKGSADTLFVAPGMYAIVKDTGTVTVKKRGMPSGLNYGWLLREWGCTTQLNSPGVNADRSPTTRFIGMGQALQGQESTWGTFQTYERVMQNVTLCGTSKRFPLYSEEAWKEFRLMPRPRPEECCSYPYRWREEYDPKEAKE